MLRYLAVRHLAVIDELQIEFEPGLNILTGETGAGKSVLVEAIDLLLGGRASADLVRTGEEGASVQAIFDHPGGREIIVRRELSSGGRSRAFVDDALATSAALKDLGATLVELHGQHQHQSLLDPATHVHVLDAFARHDAAVGRVAAAFDAWQTARRNLDRVRLDDREKRARIAMASFQLQDIDRTAPAAGEDDRLAAERAVLAQADRVTRLSSEAFDLLYDAESAALTSLSGVWKRVTELATIDTGFAPYLEHRDAVKSALEDLALHLRRTRDELDASPERLQQVEDRLAALERLKKKYGPTLEAVLERRTALDAELAALGAGEAQAVALEHAEREARSTFEREAAQLSGARTAAARTLGRGLVSALAELAMPDCRVDVRVARLADPDRWTARGVDEVEIFLSANPGEDLRPLARIASGGELSRIMLAIHTLASPDAGPRTLVFDEVDAGIGGAAADAVGARLQALAHTHQVICITHLPQIAARGPAHFHIAKQVRGGRTHTAVTRLNGPDRERELGRMIAGDDVSSRVLASAREMLALRQASENTTKGESESRDRTSAARPGADKAKAKGRTRGA
jgi:DNA repair protein RecN (Recombination protein N)